MPAFSRTKEDSLEERISLSPGTGHTILKLSKENCLEIGWDEEECQIPPPSPAPQIRMNVKRTEFKPPGKCISVKGRKENTIQHVGLISNP